MRCYNLVRRSLYNATALKADLSGLQQQNSCNSSHTYHYNLDAAKQNAKIVVVGAGLAGLSAAQHLLRHGFNRTVILEATDRLGGRINSQRFGDAYCELGAKWVNIDGSHDSMYELLRQTEGLPKQIKQSEHANYVHTQGKAVPPIMADLINTLFRQLCRGFKVTDKLKSGADLRALDNVMAYFKAESDKLINVTYKEQAQKDLARDIFQSLFQEFSSVLGCCLEYVNIEQITSCPLKQEMGPIFVPTGLDNVLEALTQDIEKKQLHVGKPVGKIQWQSLTSFDIHSTPHAAGADPKCVGCLDGSLFTADHIICTLPLGVLKNFANVLFKPDLPLEKLQAIRNLGYGNPVKIYLAYKRPINRWLKASVRPLGTQLRHDQPYVDVNGRQERIWTQHVIDISQLPSSQHVLEIRVGGGYYDEIEKLPDVTLLEQITALLRQCLSNRMVPYPQALLRSNWSSSACYLGGRPYFSTTSSSRDVQRLAAPLGESSPTLLFAGDATALNGFGTIDGARQSGIREAQRIIDFYHMKQYM